VRHAGCGKAHEIAGADFGGLAVNVGHRAAGDDVDPFLFEHVRVIGEAILAGRQLHQAHMRAAHAGQAREAGSAEE
jgi:hypothetical protein